MKLNIEVKIVKVGESYIAGTTLGGFHRPSEAGQDMTERAKT